MLIRTKEGRITRDLAVVSNRVNGTEIKLRPKFNRIKLGTRARYATLKQLEETTHERARLIKGVHVLIGEERLNHERTIDIITESANSLLAELQPENRWEI